ncbi:MAG: hypothetical protein ACM3UZ_03835 [Acidobacteriota bacterium]
MPRPPKSIHLIKSEGNKRHLTKKEIEHREKAEKALLTGSSLKEWPEIRKSKVAHKEFLRLKKLLKAIEKDDALHEAIINRYCLLLAECKDFEDMKAMLLNDMVELMERHAAGEVEFPEYIDRKDKIHTQIMACDRKNMDKRKMMLQIEKESLLTIASALRAIPKKPEEKKESPMAQFLKRKTLRNDSQ